MLVMAVACLAGYVGATGTGFSGGRLASTAPTTNIETVVVTWQPRSKTSEFLGAWRPSRQPAR